MRRFLFYLVPSFLLVCSIAVMLGGSYLKKAGGTEDRFFHSLETVSNEINNEQWEAALINLEELTSVWKEVLPKIQFCIDRDEAIQINVRLARLQGLIIGRDPAASLAELHEIKERWQNLTE